MELYEKQTFLLFLPFTLAVLKKDILCIIGFEKLDNDVTWSSFFPPIFRQKKKNIYGSEFIEISGSVGF